jgi:putative transposase
VDFTFPSEKVVAMVKQVIQWREKPEELRTDNGTEFIAKAFKGFCNKLRH